MADASTAGAPAGAAAPAAATGTAPDPKATQQIDDAIELDLDSGKVKVPRSKLDPHLAKYRSETDRLRSEHDKNDKSLKERTSKLEAVLKAAKDNPDDALKALGLDPDSYADAKLAARVKAAIREAEEKDDPTKKSARERDEELESLRQKLADKDKQDEAAKRDRQMGQIRGFVEGTIALMPEEMREFARTDVISLVRHAIDNEKDITKEEAAKAAQKMIIQRLNRNRKHLLAEDDPKPITHPAQGGKKPTPKPASNGAAPPTAGDFLQNLIFGKK